MIKATHVPESAKARAGGPEAVRYATQPMWPGITRPFDARCATCSWAYKDGIYQVKYRDVACMVHRRAASHG